MRGTWPNKKRTETGGEMKREKGDMVHDCKKKVDTRSMKMTDVLLKTEDVLFARSFGHFAKTCKNKKA